MMRNSLQLLKELRTQGKTRTVLDESDDDEDIPLKHHLDDEDFVVDDDGEGYIEDRSVPVQTPNPKRSKPENTLMNAFKRAPRLDATPVRKSDISCDDLFAQLSTKPAGQTKPKRGLMTPMTPTPARKPLVGARPVMRSFAEIAVEPSTAEPTSDQTELAKTTVEPSETVVPAVPADTSALDDSDSDLDISAVSEHNLALNSDPPVPFIPKVQYDASSYPTPNQSSEPDFEAYDQNVVDFSDMGVQSAQFDPGEDMDFFFTDFYEIGAKLMLYGRTTGTTACVIVENLYRNVFFLPAHGLEVKDIQSEIVGSISKLTGTGILSRPFNKKYCFGDSDIPTEAMYLQVQVPFSVPADRLYSLVNKSKVRKVFGAETTLYEAFMLERKVKGPNWLRAQAIKHLPATTTSCGITASVDFKNIKPVSDAPSMPTMTLMSLSLRTWLNPTTKTQEIVSISARFFKNVAHDSRIPASQLPSTVITGIRPINGVFPMKFTSMLKEDQDRAKFKSIFEHRNETAMLKWFLPYLKKHDPDMIIGHNLENIHLGILFERLKALSINTWHFMGRLGTSARMPQRVDKNSLKYWIPGRLCCDLNNDMGKSSTPKCTTWSLTEMCKLYLDETRSEIDFDVAKSPWDLKNAKGLIMMLRQNERDTLALVSLAVSIQIIPLSKVLTNLAGNSWFRTLSGSRVDRNNNLLLHEFTAANYIVPEKKVNNNTDGTRGKAKFTGGLVLEPEKGLCRNMVLVMDFNSLYPSIIREFNICFSTVDLRARDNEDELPALPGQNVSQGVFPRIIQTLVERRQEAKNAMKNPTKTDAEKQELDIRQQALKLTANSMYGCLGFEASRFYAMPLAELVTSKGREILQATRTLAQDSNDLQVLYGDTDSLMINTRTMDYDTARNLGNDFKRQVNARYRKLEIDIDYVFSSLLLNAKKKYAALKVSRNKENQLVHELEVKGIDLRRREFCDLSKEMSKQALHLILEGEDLDTSITEFYEYLKVMAAKIRGGEIPLAKYLIRTKLGKDPLKYSETEAKKSAHVVLALRRLKQGEIIKADDFMQYVIVAGSEPQAERARTMAEALNQNLVIDYDYYLLTQIFNPIKRICANIEGFDDNQIADCLGIEKKHVVVHQHHHTEDRPAGQKEEYAKFETTMSAAERFKDCAPLTFRCCCRHEFNFRGIDDLSVGGIQCPECKTPMSKFLISTQLQKHITREIERYYQGWTICSECKHETRQLGVIGRNCLSQNGRCAGRVTPVYTSRALYSQLSYYLSLFELPEADQKYKLVVSQNEEQFDQFKALATRYLDNNARRIVDMKSLFAMI